VSIASGVIWVMQSAHCFSGVIADLFGLAWAVGLIGVLTFLAGVIVAVKMRETIQQGHSKISLLS
jgi:hypothetical protein